MQQPPAKPDGIKNLIHSKSSEGLKKLETLNEDSDDELQDDLLACTNTHSRTSMAARPSVRAILSDVGEHSHRSLTSHLSSLAQATEQANGAHNDRAKSGAKYDSTTGIEGTMVTVGVTDTQGRRSIASVSSSSLTPVSPRGNSPRSNSKSQQLPGTGTDASFAELLKRASASAADMSALLQRLGEQHEVELAEGAERMRRTSSSSVEKKPSRCRAGSSDETQPVQAQRSSSGPADQNRDTTESQRTETASVGVLSDTTSNDGLDFAAAKPAAAAPKKSSLETGDRKAMGKKQRSGVSLAESQAEKASNRALSKGSLGSSVAAQSQNYESEIIAVQRASSSNSIMDIDEREREDDDAEGEVKTLNSFVVGDVEATRTHTPPGRADKLPKRVSIGLILRDCWDEHQRVVGIWEEQISMEVYTNQKSESRALKSRKVSTKHGDQGYHRSMELSMNAQDEDSDEVSNRHTYMLYPGGWFRLCWNAFCLALITYDLFMIPMAAFDVGEGGPFTVVDWFATVVWTLDLLLSFRTGYYVGSYLELRPSKVATHYAKTWLLIDSIIVGTEWMGRFTSVIGSASLLRTSRVFRTIRFMKLLRLAKFRDLWGSLKDQCNSNILQLAVSMTLLTVAVMVAIHLVSCGWYAIGKTPDGWTADPDYGGSDGRPMFFWYVASARWAIAQLNGRTDMDPDRNMVEMGYTCLAGILLAVIAKAIFTSVLTKTMIDASDLAAGQNRRRRLVNDYLDRHQISTVLVASVKSYLRDYQDIDKESKNEQLVLAFLPKHIQADLLCEVRAPTLLVHPLFRMITMTSRAAVRHICRAVMTSHPAVNSEVVFDKGDACSRILFINDGDLMYGEPFGTTEEDLDAEDAPLVAAHNEHSCKVANCQAVFAGMWICEPALWVNWTNQGRLVANRLSYVYALEATLLAETLDRHLDSYACTVLYARTVVDQLKHQSDLSDILSFDITASCQRSIFERELVVTLIQGKGLNPQKREGLFNKSDFYVVGQVHGLRRHTKRTRFKTEVISNETCPTWKMKNKLVCNNYDQSLEFQLWEHDPFPSSDELIGYCILDAFSLPNPGETLEKELQIGGSNKASGRLLVSVAAVEVNSSARKRRSTMMSVAKASHGENKQEDMYVGKGGDAEKMGSAVARVRRSWVSGMSSRGSSSNDFNKVPMAYAANPATVVPTEAVTSSACTRTGAGVASSNASEADKENGKPKEEGSSP
eukprot:TRINITY_DN101636_c0_g1_i1.p1 TRINITY_DN101636_c0_g1~~TRINITY_DN101636_c0_g1_i1.p1  ORF type:complete len:1219 (+),score=251.34 TRINITY_DN101636_c0_g1_i1:163-3819(+)